jgi:hypothetical protein
VDLERGPLSLVSTIENLLGRKSSGSCLESREYGRSHPSRRPRSNLYPQKLELTSPANGGRSVCIVRAWTKATKFGFSLVCLHSLSRVTDNQLWMKFCGLPICSFRYLSQSHFQKHCQKSHVYNVFPIIILILADVSLQMYTQTGARLAHSI